MPEHLRPALFLAFLTLLYLAGTIIALQPQR